MGALLHLFSGSRLARLLPWSNEGKLQINSLTCLQVVCSVCLSLRRDAQRKVCSSHFMVSVLTLTLKLIKRPQNVLSAGEFALVFIGARVCASARACANKSIVSGLLGSATRAWLCGRTESGRERQAMAGPVVACPTSYKSRHFIERCKFSIAPDERVTHSPTLTS